MNLLYCMPNYNRVTAYLNTILGMSYTPKMIKLRHKSGGINSEAVDNIVGTYSVWFSSDFPDEENVKIRSNISLHYIQPNFALIAAVLRARTGVKDIKANRVMGCWLGTSEKYHNHIHSFLCENVGSVNEWREYKASEGSKALYWNREIPLWYKLLI